ncbi:hypothetical protein FJ364_01970 [Candidatus Dependentiae bacterium]|nr:hypothetical protein [Candidatus Dependentiae bacterium]
MNKKYIFLMIIGLSAVQVYADKKIDASAFIISKEAQPKESNLSKDALKERMGESVREALYALFDSAASVVQTQRIGTVPLATTCALHEKIITLQRKLSRVAESLIDSHFVYKKNHKKRLEESLELLKSCALECKEAGSQLQKNAEKDSTKKIETITVAFTSLETKLSHDACLKTI